MRFKAQMQLVSKLFILICIFSLNSYAADSILNITAPDELYTKEYLGQEFYCLKKNDKFYFGIPKENNTKFKNTIPIAKAKIATLKLLILLEPDPLLKKKLQKKLKKKIAKFKTKKTLCKEGPELEENPEPEEYSMLPLNRAVTEEDLRYLGVKAGFGPEDNVIQVGLSSGLASAVDEFMRVKEEPANLEYIATDYADNVLNNVDDQLLRGGTRLLSNQGISRSMIYRLVNTNNSFRERFVITLLGTWTVNSSVLNSQTMILMWDYLNILRLHAGDANAISLAFAITRDALMLDFLDNANNVAGNPNENYARELFELFTTGTVDKNGNPNYTEDGDIVAAAKALTGWTLVDFPIPGTGLTKPSGIFSPALHEPGLKTIFAGKAYQTLIDDDEDLIFAIFNNHPGTAYYYSSQLLKEYLTEEPAVKLIENFATIIKSNGFDLTNSLKVLFQSRAFYSSIYKNSLAKNSIETAIQFIRALAIPVNIENTEFHITNSMSMGLTQAPSVFWWDRDTWYSPSVNLGAMNLYARVLSDLTAQSRDPNDPNDDWRPEQVCPIGQGITALDTINFIAKKLNITVPTTVISQLEFFMNNRKNSSGVLVSDPYDSLVPAKVRSKCLGVYYILGMSPNFKTK